MSTFTKEGLLSTLDEILDNLGPEQAENMATKLFVTEWVPDWQGVKRENPLYLDNRALAPYFKAKS